MGIPTLVVYESRNDVQTKTIAYQTNWDKIEHRFGDKGLTLFVDCNWLENIWNFLQTN